MSLGNSRWGILVRDTIPSDNPQRRFGSHSFFSQAISATVANFSPATCRWGNLSPSKCLWGIVAGESSSGIQSPAIIPSEDV
ncbi:hypothetical protein Tco_0029468, partial [Tanacetum coccineum]